MSVFACVWLQMFDRRAADTAGGVSLCGVKPRGYTWHFSVIRKKKKKRWRRQDVKEKGSVWNAAADRGGSGESGLVHMTAICEPSLPQ